MDPFPKELRDAPRWGSWHYDETGNKIPDQEIDQLQKWGAFSRIEAAPRKAFLFTEVDPWFSIDIDFKKTKTASTEQLEIISAAIKHGMYVERSPSKFGFHLWARVDKSKWPRSPTGRYKAVKRDELGIEIYCANRYFTMSGDASKPYPNGLPDVTDFALALIEKYTRQHTPRETTTHDKAEPEQVRKALALLDPNCSYDEWLRIGQALHDWDDAFEMWDAWSAGSAEKYPGSGQLQNKWQSFTAGGGVTIGSLFDLAKAKGFTFKPDAIADFSDKKLPEEKKAKVPPAPAAARELVTYAASRVKVKKIDWVWQDYLARGTFHMIVGVQGDGKSVFCYGMIAALTGGRSFINGDKPAQTGRVLLIQGEEDPATIIVPRLEAAGADLQRVSIVSHAREREANEDVQRAFSLQDDVASTRILLEQAELMDDPIIAIVVDPITAYMAGKKKIDAFRDDEMRSMLMPWVRLINKYDVALIVVAHLNKTSGQRAVHRVAQSAAATAAARAVYLVGPANGVADFSEDPNLKIFVPAKYNLGKNPTAQLFTVDGYQHPITQQSVGFAVSKGIANVSADDVLSARKSIERVTPLRDRIWDCVNASGGDGMTRKQIAGVISAQMESAGFQSAIKIMLDQQLLIENKRKLFTPAQFSNRAGAELLI